MSIKKISGYKIKMDQVLGCGAFGHVYKGQKDETGIQCAIKVIDKRIVKDDYLKSALDSEIQIMSKLNSQNIIGFFDVLMSNHNFYIVQELCDSDLERQLHEKTLPEDKAIEFLTQICNGFLALIKEGIVHRDLKPANILINKGKLKIADFGFAKINLHKKVKNISCVGTPLYMSIQVLKSIGYTSKCDIWSLGCIFYEMLHGKTPWTAKSQYELVQNIQTKPLEINQNLSTNTKKFLISTLKVLQQQRICWDDLFKHPIFKGYFNKYISQNIKLQNKYKKVMSELRFRVNSQNIDLESLWKSLKITQKCEIDFPLFQNFLNKVNPDMRKQEQLYFFEKLDTQGKGSLNLVQLSKQLQKHNISTSSSRQKKVPFGITQMNSLNIQTKNQANIQTNIDTNIQANIQTNIQTNSLIPLIQVKNKQEKAQSYLLKIHKKITNKNVGLFNCLKTLFFQENSNELKMHQFSNIMLRLNPRPSNEQIKQVFDLFAGKSKGIKFQEINKYYCKVLKSIDDEKQEKQNHH